MRRIGAAAVLTLALGVYPAAQESIWSDWPYVRAILVEEEFAALISVRVPPGMQARTSPDLHDVRVIDDLDREVPFLVHAPRGVHRLQWQPVRLLETSVLRGAYTQVLADTGTTPAAHNRIELSMTETDFFAWVEVAASDDRGTWRILDERLPLYRFARDGHAGTPVLGHAPSVSRYLRIRLMHTEPLTVTGVRIAEEVVEPPVRVPLPATVATVSDAPDRHTAWQADFGGRPPVSEVVFSTSAPEFHRPVRVAASSDGRTWRRIGDGEIYRLRRSGGTVEQLEVTVPEIAAPFLRVEVFNRDDPPVPDLEVTFRGVPRDVVVRPEPGRHYRLIYGRAGAAPPAYELPRLVTTAEIRRASAAALGPEGAMPGHPRPDPWTERHGVVLWLAVALTAAVLAWLALRTLRTERRS